MIGKKTISEKIFDFLNAIFMIVMIVVTAYPIYYCVIASVSDPNKLAATYGANFLPLNPITFGGYQKVFEHPSLSAAYSIRCLYL